MKYDGQTTDEGPRRDKSPGSNGINRHLITNCTIIINTNMGIKSIVNIIVCFKNPVMQKKFGNTSPVEPKNTMIQVFLLARTHSPISLSLLPVCVLSPIILIISSQILQLGNLIQQTVLKSTTWQPAGLKFKSIVEARAVVR